MIPKSGRRLSEWIMRFHDSRDRGPGKLALIKV
jgi:hypothetical protein